MLDSTPAPSVSTPLIERRKGYRQPIQASAMLRAVAVAPDQAIVVHVFEHSISGVAFSTARAMEIGSVWRFDMCAKRQLPRRVEIRSCRARHDGMFDVGAMFC
jgi:hypothetical protein